MTLHDEILEQPTVARGLLESGWPVVERIAAVVRDRDIDGILIAARGTSDHAAIYAQYLFGIANRVPVALAAPSIVTLYGVAPRMPRTLVIGISQSGASPDVVAVLNAARGDGAPTVAITNEPTSALAGAADLVLDLAAGNERSVAATKTYTAELTAIAMLSAALGNDAERRAELSGIPTAIEAALDAEEASRAAAAARAEMQRAVVLGRGLEYATGREWALKLKELCRVMADPYSAADFRHGPLALVEPGLPVLAVATSGPAWADLAALLARLRDEFGVDLVVVSDRPEAGALGERLPVPAHVPDWLRPIATIVPAQLFALHLALAKGLDPEHPANIQKVTLTR
jgi:glucosamine--fructose-6-phosphate aminotransferase (isomerizing)